MKHRTYDDVSIVLLAAFIALIIAAAVSIPIIICYTENNRIDEGVIINKQYRKGSVARLYITTEKYKFEIQGDKNGKTVNYWINVSEYEYNSHNIGDYFKKPN